MSVRKTAAAKVATKPKLAPEPAKRTNAKKAATPPPTKSAPGTVENVSAAAEKLAAEIDRALAEGRTDDARAGIRSFLEHGPGHATFTGH